MLLDVVAPLNGYRRCLGRGRWSRSDRGNERSGNRTLGYPWALHHFVISDKSHRGPLLGFLVHGVAPVANDLAFLIGERVS